MIMNMFCYQCQEASKGTGCEISGVCGKTPEVSALQDLLVYQVKGLSHLTTALRLVEVESIEANKFIVESLFMTITNANFDDTRFVNQIRKGLKLRSELKVLLQNHQVEVQETELLTWTALTITEMEQIAQKVGVLSTENEDVRSLRELIVYGLKGMAAYLEHAWNLGYDDTTVYSFIQRALVATTNDQLTGEELTALALETGQYGVSVMALLDNANTSTYGNPEITKVNIGVRNNPAILISGHDLKDMEELLRQTEGTGVDVYTHSEMLPAHYYPAFKKYSHFVGNYGGAWWSQVSDFESFNGPVLFTTNCIVPPRKSATYTDRIYTTGAAGYPGFVHIEEGKDGEAKDFSAIIAHAKQLAAPTEIETGEIVGGFAHAQVFALADKVVDAVKSGAIRRFFVMAGCDGRMKERNYYSDFAQQLPADTVILTAGCAKYRYNKLPLGDIGGIPRVLDAGQCNDSFSLAVIALKLKEVFVLNDINDLPITYNIAWYEQKAVIVLLALLHLGVKNIHLGPTLPAFLSPNVAKVLVDNFGIAPIGSVEKDLEMFLA
jgi:hydroxylamine reductase